MIEQVCDAIKAYRIGTLPNQGFRNYFSQEAKDLWGKQELNRKEESDNEHFRQKEN